MILSKVPELEVVQTPHFKRSVKKLKENQKADLFKAIREVMKNPLIGQQKKGDINDIRVHKFKMVKQLTLIAYDYEDNRLILTLIMFGSHENFYRDFKRAF